MKKVVLTGPVLSRSGYGEHARYMFRALNSRPDLYDIYIIPTGWGQSSWLHEKSGEIGQIKELIEKTQQVPGLIQGNLGADYFDISLQVTIPNEWQKIAKYNIGVTAAVETTKASGKWIHHSNNIVDRIFVTSTHAEKSLVDPRYVMGDSQNRPVGELKLEKPVDVISYPVRNIPQESSVHDKIELETEFNFLTIAQSGPRKNLNNTISWFLEEFGKSSDVGLVIKAHHLNNSAMDRFNLTNQLRSITAAYPDKLCKIYLVHGNLTDGEMASLYTHPNIHAYITATHGEGFGLPIFEAAYSAMPVVAPPWSGHTDFLYADVVNEKSGRTKRTPLFTKIKYELRTVQPEAVWEDIVLADSKWCFVDANDFRKSIRKVYDAYLPKKRQAEKLSQILKTNLEESKMFEKVVECVNKVLPEDMGELEDWFEQFNDSVVIND